MITTKALPFHIDTFPETAGAQQHRVAVLAKLQQLLARCLALHQQGKRSAGPSGAQDLGRLTQRAMAGEQQERTPASACSTGSAASTTARVCRGEDGGSKALRQIHQRLSA